MAKNKSIIYVCADCGGEHYNWEGRCRFCQAWNTLKEFNDEKIRQAETSGKVRETQTFNQVASDGISTKLVTGIKEFDRVLGDGIVQGSVILLGGDPGIGKSTLLLQVAHLLSNRNRTLYISGEESLAQLKIRAARIFALDSPLQILNETSIPNIVETIRQIKPQVVIIDSIQTMYHPDYPSTPGSIVQVRECSLRLQQLAKKENVSIILVGHITKEGTVAGPKTLEHLVDVVLYLEGEKYHNIRILRGVKNRFGDVSESGLFEMQNNGLIEISNPSKIFLSEMVQAPGSVIAATLEGRRPILVEIQALVKKTVFGYPKRTSAGFDLNRLQLLIAVLEKRAGVNLENSDVFLNIVGGLKIKEPAIDLAIITAIASAKNNQIISDHYVFWGEVGLVGEIRLTVSEKLRSDEAIRLGYAPWPKTKTINELLSKLSLINKNAILAH